MSNRDGLSPAQTQTQRLMRGLAQRHMLPATDPARAAVDAVCLQTLDEMSRRQTAEVPDGTGTRPPRRVAIAMAMAILSHPHLSATYGYPMRGGTVDIQERDPYPPEVPLLMSVELMETALDISRWELEDIQEDIDRRTGQALKQERALDFLWNYFHLPDSGGADLARILLPGLDELHETAQVVRRAQRLYLLLDIAPSSTATLHLSWWSRATRPTGAQLPVFRARYVDSGLRRSLARGIGAEPAEVDWILNRMLTMLPNDAPNDWLELDQWRVTGLASMTGIGDDYVRGFDLVRPLEVHGLDWADWLVVKDGKLTLMGGATSIFDDYALRRTRQIMTSLYGSILAQTETESPGHTDGVDALDVLDMAKHLSLTLEPLIEWAQSPDTHEHIAAQLRVDRDEAKRLLSGMAEAWLEHMNRTWLGIPTRDNTRTMASAITEHLVVLRQSLRHLLHRSPDHRWDHRQIALLFAGHYLYSAPVHRLWQRHMSDMPAAGGVDNPPHDAIGAWFWTTWQNVLEALEADAAPTF